MKSDLEKTRLRTIQYWYVDGTYEFSMGGLCLLLAFFFYTQGKFEGTFAEGITTILMVLFIVFGGLGINKLVMRLKERVTFPRTGYVSYKRTRGKLRFAKLLVIGLIAGLLAALVTLLMVQLSSDAIVAISKASPRPINWMPGITGLLFAIAIIIVAFRTAIPRFYVIAVLSLLLGITLMFAGLNTNFGLAAFYGLLAAGMLIMGGITFRNYLSTSIPPTEADND